jgi:putative transposase
MDERLRFVARVLEGEKMTALCAEFGISRKTGYKIYDRYKDCGVVGLSDRSRRPQRQANQLPAPVEARIVYLKREYPGCGAPKIREKLRQQVPDLPHCPAISTVHAGLDRHGLVHRRRRRRPRAAGTELSRPLEPNALWCADYKGEFMLANRRYCCPLTNHRLCQPVSADLRGPLDDAGEICRDGVRARLQGLWPARRDSDG